LNSEKSRQETTKNAHLGRADACPAVIKDILFRAAERAKIPMTLVANKLLRTPPSPFIKAVRWRADRRGGQPHRAWPGGGGSRHHGGHSARLDVIAKGGHALNPRGILFAGEHPERLALRNYLESCAARGAHRRAGGAGQHGQERFADQLDRFLTKLKR